MHLNEHVQLRAVKDKAHIFIWSPVCLSFFSFSFLTPSSVTQRTHCRLHLFSEPRSSGLLWVQDTGFLHVSCEHMVDMNLTLPGFRGHKLREEHVCFKAGLG